MITMDDLKRLLNPLKRKLYLLLGRAILTIMDNSGEAQVVQITMLKNETITDIERPQDFGFDSVPPVEASDGIAAFINGNRDHGVVLRMQCRTLRPTDLVEGESAIYSNNDATDTHRIHLKADGSTEIIGKAANQSIILKTDGSIENLSGTSKIINDGGKVALGTTTNELLDLIDQMLTELIGATVVDTGTPAVPAGVWPLLPLTITNLTAIQVKLATITGSI